MKRQKNRIERSGNNFRGLMQTSRQLDEERNALTRSTGSTRFHYDSESGFVLNQATGEWLTTIEEVFDTMKAEIDDIFLQWEARQRDYDAAQAENVEGI